MTLKVLSDLESKGWSHFSVRDINLDKLFHTLGHVIMENDVCINPKSPSLVTSAKALPPHTDHHLAHYILWHCIVQDSKGGHSIIVDGLDIFESMNQEIQELLRSINLIEHSVFKNDLETHPMISSTSTGDRIYYSFWLADEKLSEEQKRAFNVFNKAVRDTKQIRIRLKPDECLVVDNGRILHGRSSLIKSSARLLKRYWIGDSFLEKVDNR